MVAAQLQAAGRSSWLTYAASEAEGVEPAEWLMWEKYVRAFDRGFLVVLGEGQRGQTREEVKSGGRRGGTLSTSIVFCAGPVMRPAHTMVFDLCCAALALSVPQVALALFGVLGGTLWLAYFTSTMVQLVTSIDLEMERARAKIGRVATFCKHASLPNELDTR
eukprot:846223-Prymnesium_polylepis.1